MDLSDDEVDGANNDIPTLDDSLSAPKDTKKGKTVGVDERALARFNEDMQKRGVVYLSRIPPFMKPLKIRQYFSQFGKIDRVYLTPEDERVRLKRKKMGGNKRQKFIDGWVEFCDKKIAKRVALNLNGEPIGGAKSNYWRDDIWTIKYLPKFKWHHLAESIAYQNRVAEEKMRNEVAQAKRENNEYLDAVDKAAQLNKMRERKRAEGTELPEEEQER